MKSNIEGINSPRRPILEVIRKNVFRYGILTLLTLGPIQTFAGIQQETKIIKLLKEYDSMLKSLGVSDTNVSKWGWNQYQDAWNQINVKYKELWQKYNRSNNDEDRRSAESWKQLLIFLEQNVRPILPQHPNTPTNTVPGSKTETEQKSQLPTELEKYSNGIEILLGQQKIEYSDSLRSFINHPADSLIVSQAHLLIKNSRFKSELQKQFEKSGVAKNDLNSALQELLNFLAFLKFHQYNPDAVRWTESSINGFHYLMLLFPASENFGKSFNWSDPEHWRGLPENASVAIPTNKDNPIGVVFVKRLPSNVFVVTHYNTQGKHTQTMTQKQLKVFLEQKHKNDQSLSSEDIRLEQTKRLLGL